MTNSIEEEKFDTDEAAKYTKLSASTLAKRRVFGGGPKYLKLGRRVVYSKRDLDDWLDAHRRTSTSDSGKNRYRQGLAQSRRGRASHSAAATSG